MKYVISLVAGMLTGVALLALLLFFNPLTSSNNLSPLSVTDNEVLFLNYSAVAENSLLYTNDGESQITPHPAKVQQLWEPPVSRTSARAMLLTDGRGEIAGFGIKFSSHSDRTSVLDGEVLVDSVWHIYLPAQGTLFVEQTENYWSYLREVVIPAYWSSGNSWRGTWRGNITSGPGALGTAKVAGGNGRFAAVDTEAVEALSAKAYSVEQGPVAMGGEILIEIPRGETVAGAVTE